MKKLIFLLLFIFSSESFARPRDCYKKISQANKNECMTLERDKAIGQLMIKITLDCSEKEEIKESKGGTIYPMLLDECMTLEIRRIIKQYFYENLKKDD